MPLPCNGAGRASPGGPKQRHWRDSDMTTLILDDLSEAARRRLLGTSPARPGAQPEKAPASAASVRRSTQYRGRNRGPASRKPT